MTTLLLVAAVLAAWLVLGAVVALVVGRVIRARDERGPRG